MKAYQVWYSISYDIIGYNDPVGKIYLSEKKAEEEWMKLVEEEPSDADNLYIKELEIYE